MLPKGYDFSDVVQCTMMSLMVEFWHELVTGYRSNLEGRRGVMRKKATQCSLNDTRVSIRPKAP